jgi:hypothetical protein
MAMLSGEWRDRQDANNLSRRLFLVQKKRHMILLCRQTYSLETMKALQAGIGRIREQHRCQQIQKDMIATLAPVDQSHPSLTA